MDPTYSNILIRMPNWLGDAVMATPVLEDLKTHFPKAKLTAMCQGGIEALLAANPMLDEIFTFRQPNEFERRQEQRKLIDRLKQGKYDLGILLSNSFSSAWLFWRANIPHRLGYIADWRRFLLSTAVPFPAERATQHLVTTYKQLLAPLGIPLSSTEPKLFLTQEERLAAQKILRSYHIPEGATLIGINPGAAFGSAKCWLPDRFRQVTELLMTHPNFYVLYFGDRAGASLVHDICEGLPGRVIDLAGATNLRQLIALIERCSLFLTNDSGPMHIAAALKTPLIALFGSTNDTTTGPYKQGVVLHKHEACSPCYQRTCPLGHFRCMKAIETQEVYRLILQILAQQAANPQKTAPFL